MKTVKKEIGRLNSEKRFFLLLLICIGSIILLSSNALSQNRDATSRPFNVFNLRNLRFDFSVPSARPLSMGGAAIALSDDPTSVIVNPAGVAFFVRPAISSSVRLTTQRFKEPSYDCALQPGDIEDRDFLLDQTMVSAVVPFMENVYFATFREVIFDARLSYQNNRPLLLDDDASAEDIISRNFPSQRTVLKMGVVDNGGSIAWQINEKLNFGASLRLTRFEYSLNDRQYFNSHYGNDPAQCLENTITPANLYLIQTVDKKDWGVGFSAGILSRLTSRLVVGAVYHRRANFDLNSTIFLPRYAVNRGDSLITFESREDTTTHVRLNIPDSYGIGLAYKYRGWMNLTMDLIRIRYSELANASPGVGNSRDPRDLIQDNDANGFDPEGTSDLGQGDRWEFHAGLEYIFRVLPQKYRLPVRIGYYFDPSHIIHSVDDKPELNLSFPKAGDEHHFTLGLGFFWGKGLRLDGAVDISANSLEFVGSSVYVF